MRAQVETDPRAPYQVLQCIWPFCLVSCGTGAIIAGLHAAAGGGFHAGAFWIFQLVTAAFGGCATLQAWAESRDIEQQQEDRAERVLLRQSREGIVAGFPVYGSWNAANTPVYTANVGGTHAGLPASDVAAPAGSESDEEEGDPRPPAAQEDSFTDEEAGSPRKPGGTLAVRDLEAGER